MGFKVCTIGCGRHATRVHGPSYRKYADAYPDTVLAACCDIDPAKAQSYKETFGFQSFYTDIETMLENEKPDAVCLIVGEPLISPLSVKVMEQGFPLMMEKPPGMTREETMRMLAAAQTSGVYHKVAFNRWYAPMMLKLKELMSTNINSADIHQIRYDFYRVGRKGADFAVTAIHGVSAVAFLADSSFKRVRFTYQELPEIGVNVANYYLECEFESGAIAHLHICPVAGVVIERATINASDHTFFLELPIWSDFDDPGRLMHVKSGQLQQDIEGSSVNGGEELYITNGFYGENEAFFNSVREGRLPEGDLEKALQIVEISDCLRLRKQEYIRV